MAPASSGANPAGPFRGPDGGMDPLRPEANGPEAELAPRFWGRVRVFALRRVGDFATAEDVAQETLRRVGDAMRAGRIQQPAALAAFVFQTARHICMQLQRGAGRESRALARALTGARAAVVPLAPPDALSALIAEERCTAVRAALARLEAGDVEVLRLTYYDLLGADQIAERLGTTPGAIRVRKHRALRRLADQLGAGTSNIGASSGTS
jgi:RNA polymerase sigma factor (sigma-70 family)